MKHLDFIRNLPCAICAEDMTVEAAHVRFSDIRVGKTESGIGRKPLDAFTLPLCGKHHRIQHSMGERRAWQLWRIDPILVSLALYAVSGDIETGEKILSFWRRNDSSSLGFSGQTAPAPD